MCDKKELPIIIGRNDGCDTCDELGYICEDCIEEWLGDEDQTYQSCGSYHGTEQTQDCNTSCAKQKTI